MGKVLNSAAFTLSIVCVVLFLGVSFSGLIKFNILGIHPLHFIFYMTLTVFVLSVAGFAGIENWRAMVVSIATVSITLGLAAVLAFILFFGNLLS